MRDRMRCLFLSVLATSATWANDDPDAFFQKYIELGNAYDPELASLYSDNAKILSYRVYPHGTERSLEMEGVRWKQLLILSLPLAKAQGDKSTFSEVTITDEKVGFKIKANRYSERKCYTDTGYYMIVQPKEDGRLEIIEEYMETQPQSDC